jgi:hypothetical protein
VPLAGCCDCFKNTANALAIWLTTDGINVPPIVPLIPETPIINASMK